MSGSINKRSKFIITAILTLCSIAVFAQDSIAPRYRYQHELGIDVANILTFLKKNQQSYMANYKWHYRQNRAVRVGLNLELSNQQSEGVYPDVRVGHQWGYITDNWMLYGGADASVAYNAPQFLKNTLWRYGLSPVVGVQYYFNKHISLSTEISLNCYYYIPREPDSFDPAANKPFYRVKIGSVGMLMINYHFGKKKK
ncbi:hypothetical protein [Chitinophaga nivalis]|uniref:DUF3575 domain-containing protein n=1 Tax=Chitinophaga nivalis TaxID=2991709 RepID=A0ABT3IUT1_9BACT|nr:hypothetical protein [Chitinophaga nivalis]MCW3462562.1 hypothetical protein [Chitinophaga nivalis]MCW3487747.1 hypothetical protein [Chitinophaga nivalis]